eukprot:PhF_6_TR11679/c0_g2_i1/m.18918
MWFAELLFLLTFHGCILTITSSTVQLEKPTSTSWSGGRDLLCSTITSFSGTESMEIVIPYSIYWWNEEDEEEHLPCDLTLPNQTITLSCTSNAILLSCPKSITKTNTPTEEVPCFRVLASNVSLSIIGCSMQHSAVVMSSLLGGSLLISGGSVLDGMKSHVPINVYNAEVVILQNIIVINGSNTRSWMGGGCISLRGVRSLVRFDNVTTRNCTSSRIGGCVAIVGDNGTVVVVQESDLSFMKYSDTIVIQNSLLEYCSSTESGLLDVSFYNTMRITNNIFSHGVATGLSEGCIRLFAMSVRSAFVFEDNMVANCIAKGMTGCVLIQPFDAVPREEINLQPIVIRRNIIRNCYAGASNGGLRVVETYRPLVVQDVILHNCTGVFDGGCVIINANSSLLFANVTMTDCAASANHGGAMLLINLRY